MAQPNPDENHATKTDNASQLTMTEATSATEQTPLPLPVPVPIPIPVPANVSTPQTTTALVPPKKTQNDFVFGKCIGEGSFSTVYLAADKCTQREYAIKVCDKRHILREGKQEYVRREREVLQLLSNVPGFVRLMCTFQDSRSLFFVMTFATNGELLPHIKRVGCFSPECARHYAAELVLACEQMHRRNVVHRDLKPENILLDKGMHTLIADFGSAKVLTAEDLAAAAAALAASTTPTSSASSSATSLPRASGDNDDNDDDYDEAFGDGVASGGRDAEVVVHHPSLYRRKRRGSFVGTAQYVSPEVLQNVPITPAADLWALGCIVYQMIAGMPPFRGFNDFAIFKEILAGKLSFPPHFDVDAEHLVKQLLQLTPSERLGAQDELSEGRYVSIRAHPFFSAIDFECLREQKPPKIYPFLPSLTKDDIDRLKVANLGTALEQTLHLDERRFVMDATERERQLEQQKTDKWHAFADDEVLLRKGYVNKHKGLFAQKRMLLLTTGPHLIYVDPVEMIRVGEVPWSCDLHVELISSKVFFVHTIDRTYFFDDLEDSAQEWAAAIGSIHRETYKDVLARDSTTVTDSPTPQMCSKTSSEK